LPRGEHIFAAHGAAVFVFVFEAMMGIKDTNRDTHAALITMTKGLDASHSTKAAQIAMKWLFTLKAYSRGLRTRVYVHQNNIQYKLTIDIHKLQILQ
jgi:hypothetical protein